jgi:hypothetical protein
VAVAILLGRVCAPGRVEVSGQKANRLEYRMKSESSAYGERFIT